MNQYYANIFSSENFNWKKNLSLSNSNYFTSAKMEFVLPIFEKLYFSKYSIKGCCKEIMPIQNFV